MKLINLLLVIHLTVIGYVHGENNYPIILIHGFLGWGKDEVGEMNYWGGDYDIEQYLTDKGFKVYSVSLGPVSSTYDCAIETFYQIKGGQVDYGVEHSKNYNLIQRPKEKHYSGLYPAWDENHPVHLVGYSFGGLTARMLIHLLNSTFIDESNGKPDQSELLGKHLNNWVRSVTTMSTPNNGATLSDIVVDILPFTDNLIPIANIISTSFYDFDLEQWNLSKSENETLQEYLSRLTKHPAWNTKNSIAWDSSIQGAKELNDILVIDPEIYYFSSSTVASILDTNSGHHKPAEYTHTTSYPWSWLIGRSKVDIGDGQQTDSTWFENDGTVNTISMKRPFSGKHGPEPVINLSKHGSIEPGIWNFIGQFKYDHKTFIGHFLSDEVKVKEIMTIFEDHARLLYSLP